MKKNTKIIIGSATATIFLMVLLLGLFVVKPQMDTQARINRWGIKKDVGVEMDKDLLYFKRNSDELSEKVKRASNRRVFYSVSANNLLEDEKNEFKDFINYLKSYKDSIYRDLDDNTNNLLEDHYNRLAKILDEMNDSGKYSDYYLSSIMADFTTLIQVQSISYGKKEYLPGGEKLSDDQQTTISRVISANAQKEFNDILSSYTR